MRKINKITAIFALLAAAFTASCTGEFEYFNTNQHEATEEQMEHDNLKTGAFFRQLQRSVIVVRYGENFLSSDYQIYQNLLADSYSGYLTPVLPANNGQHTAAYDMGQTGWINGQFNFTFTYAMAAWKSLRDVAIELDQPEIAALGTIVKVEAMHRTADQYGPIPYTTFGNGQINNNYDSLETVYRAFFQELDEAIDILTEFAIGNPGSTLMADYDYVYGGDVTRWVKFANTLRLRLALRVVYADESLARAEAQKSLSNTIGCMTESNDAAQLNHTADLSIYPNPIYEIAFTFNGGETMMGASMDAYMSGYNDPRLAVYFMAAADGSRHGIRPGIRLTSRDSYQQNCSFPNIGSTDNMVWMYASEAYFLRAEAALRGWGGDARSLYEQGIRTSFDERGAGSADSYISNTSRSGSFAYTPVSAISSSSGTQTISGVPSVAWAASGSFEQNLERIIIQKWISMYPNGPEGWAEARRTGYPRLIGAANDASGMIGTSAGTVIRRVVFPESEYTNNPAGVASGVAQLGGGDNVATRLWWDKK